MTPAPFALEVFARVVAAVGITGAVIVAGSLVSSDRRSLSPFKENGMFEQNFTPDELSLAASLGLFPVGDALINPQQIAGVKPHNGGVLVVFVGGGTVAHDGVTLSEGLEAIRTASQAAGAAQTAQASPQAPAATTTRKTTTKKASPKSAS